VAFFIENLVNFLHLLRVVFADCLLMIA
jgi:hypothetical protein